jgi:hypothetical protein
MTIIIIAILAITAVLLGFYIDLPVGGVGVECLRKVRLP